MIIAEDRRGGRVDSISHGTSFVPLHSRPEAAAAYEGLSFQEALQRADANLQQRNDEPHADVPMATLIHQQQLRARAQAAAGPQLPRQPSAATASRARHATSHSDAEGEEQSGTESHSEAEDAAPAEHIDQQSSRDSQSDSDNSHAHSGRRVRRRVQDGSDSRVAACTVLHDMKIH